MKKIIFAVIVLLYTSDCLANLVTFACPESHTIQFNQPQQQAYAYVQLLNGDTPLFLMQGFSEHHAVWHFKEVRYQRDEFSCVYSNDDANLILRNESVPGLEYCYFPNSNNRKQCEGSVEHCQLRCEILK